MPKNNKNINNHKASMFRLLSNAEGLWSIFSKIWIFSLVIALFWAFSLKSQKNNWIEKNNNLRDSISLLKNNLDQCNYERMVAYNFINASKYDIDILSQQISLIQQSINKYEDVDLINELKSEISKLQTQAYNLNNQIVSMRQTIYGVQKRGNQE